MNEAPTGTVTFLFTDIEGSTRLAQSHAASWESLRSRHGALLREAVEARGGVVFKDVGDAFCVAFGTAHDGIGAALAAQHALQAEPLSPAPLRVRMGLHTGQASARHGDHGALDYVGYATLARAQQVMSAAHGEQVLLSSSCAQLVRESMSDGWALQDLGMHRLKGFAEPEHLWQVVEPGLRSGFPALATSASTPNNLPRWGTRFIGRATEIAQCKALLEPGRVVTLTAIGGAGKTRLAVETARAALDDHPEGVWFVDLSQVQEASRVAQATAVALGLREEAGVPVVETIAGSLAGRRSLLVLDNCEHVLDAASDLAQVLLARCERLAMLATSREGLGIPGEQVFTVRSLAMPANADPASIARADAVALFMDRARLANPALEFDATVASDVVEICRRLDGIALAIELAAARVKVLTVRDIRTRLGDRFRLLTGGNRALPRQQTLLATLQWSFDLLTPEEQGMLCRLAVFSGGWTLRAATAVAGEDADEFEVLDVLSRLADKSLIAMDASAQGESRYSMVETLRQFALERIGAAELHDARLRHARFFVDLAAQFARRPVRLSEEWMRRVDADHENLLSAHATCGLIGDLSLPGLDLAKDTERYWRHRGLFALARQVMQEALDRPGSDDPARRAGVLDGLATIHLMLGDYDAARDACARGIAMARGLDDKTPLCDLLKNQISILNARGELAQAEDVASEAVRIAESLGGRHPATVRHHLAELRRRRGEPAAAEPLYLLNLEEAQASGSVAGVVTAVLNLALAAAQRGDADALRKRLAQFDPVSAHDAGAMDRILALEIYAVLAFLEGAPDAAARFHAASHAAAARAQFHVEPVDSMAIGPWIDRLRAALGEEAFAASLAAGAHQDVESMIREARAWTASLPADGSPRKGALG